MGRKLEEDPREFVQAIIAELTQLVNGKSVLEVACGTGNWTRLVAPGARRVTATDYSEGMLTVARSRQIPNTRFLLADACDRRALGDERHEVGLALWLVSHLPLSRWHDFITAFHAHLKPGAKVLLIDDIRRLDDGDPWYSKLDSRDTHEIRQLPNGESYEIVKTYFTPEQLQSLLEPYAENLEIRYERPIWRVTYDVRHAS
jgi:SAM-dependent methyltransferase